MNELFKLSHLFLIPEEVGFVHLLVRHLRLSDATNFPLHFLNLLLELLCLFDLDLVVCVVVVR